MTPDRPADGTVRSEIAAAHRIVVKIGSSSLTTADGGLDPARVRDLVDHLAGVRARGAELVLVSSGAIAAGLAYVTEDRKALGLVLDEPILRNVSMANLPGISRNGVIDDGREPLNDLIAALHSKLLVAELKQRRA